MSALFIPLKSKYYEQFLSGEKRSELRLYGPRWNEKTCFVGREVILSKGYGKANRTRARVILFQKCNANDLGAPYRKAVMDVYGTLDKPIALIQMRLIDASHPVPHDDHIRDVTKMVDQRKEG